MADEQDKTLTPLEREVVNLLATGCTHEQIARILELSPEALKERLAAIDAKLD